MVAAGAALAAPSAAHADSVNTRERQVRELAPGVYTIRHADPTDDFPDGNTTVVIGDREALVVDTCYLPSSANDDIALIRGWTDKPVRYIVNTHWHGDHNLGNGAFLKAFPGAEVVSHVNTLRAMTRANIGLDTTPAQLEEAIASLGKGIASGRDEQGQPLPEERLARWKTLQSDYQVALAEVRRAEIVPPTLTFEDRARVVGGAPARSRSATSVAATRTATRSSGCPASASC